MKTHLYLKQANRDGRRQIYVSVSYKGKRYQTSLGFSVSQEQFDNIVSASQGVDTILAPIEQQALDTYKTICQECARMELGISNGFIEPTSVNIPALVDKCKGRERKEPKGDHDLIHTYNRYMIAVSKSKNSTDSTQEQRRKIMNNLSEYGASIKELATLDGLERYEQWLVSRNISNITAKNYLSLTVTFLRWCYRQGLCDSSFTRYECKLKTSDRKERAVIYLTLEEIDRIAKLELRGNREVVRDVFLFQCYTGLRISDASVLTWQSIVGDKLRIIVKKTGVFIDNRLPKQALAIIDKYRCNGMTNKFVFPHLSKDIYRANLKAIGRMANIDDPITLTDYRNGAKTIIQVPKWQKLTTHVGRKTFVVNSLSMGFTANQVIKCTGHTTINALEPYVDITESAKNEIADRWSSLAGDDEDE